MQLTAVGYGAGKRLTPEPNVLRVPLGDSAAGGRGGETLAVLETNIDDMSPELHGYVVERLLGAGALDAFLTPVLMKSRPGVVISVLCRPDDAPNLRDLLFAETTTLGIRTSEVQRDCLPWEIKRSAPPLDGFGSRWRAGGRRKGGPRI